MSPQVTIFKPEGILDINKSNHLRQQVKKSIEGGNNVILIDLEKVTFMDSSGLGSLIMIRQMTLDTKGKLFLSSLNEQIKMLLFDLTDTGRFFSIIDDKSELQEKLNSE